MKRKILKLGAAVSAVALSAVIVSNVVMSHSLEAKAAPTLEGIEKLISKVQSSAGDKYTILEVVPSNPKEEAEIGYMFGGFEPALSEYDASTGKWTGWKERLENAGSDSARENLLTELSGEYDSNKILQSFVTKEKVNEGTVTVGELTKYGKFVKYDAESHAGFDRYSLSFKEAKEVTETASAKKSAMFTTEVNKTENGNKITETENGKDNEVKPEGSENNEVTSDEALSHACFYKAVAVKITTDNIDTISSDVTVYKLDGDQYISQGSFGEIQSEIKQALNSSNGTDTEEKTLDSTKEKEESKLPNGNKETEKTQDGDLKNPNDENTEDLDNNSLKQEEENKEPENTNSQIEDEQNKDASKTDNLKSGDTDTERTETDAVKSEQNKEDQKKNSDVKQAVKEENKDTELLDQQAFLEENSNHAGWLSEVKRSAEVVTTTVTEEKTVTSTTDVTAETEVTTTDVTAETEVTTTEAAEVTKYYYFDFTVTDGTAGDDGKLYVVDSIQYNPEGAYIFEEITSEPLSGGQYYTFEGREIKSNLNFRNKELFKVNVLNMDDTADDVADQRLYDSFPVEVITLTYDDLNTKGLPDFDFLYLSGEAKKDLNNDVAIQISKRVRDGKLPCILSAANLFEGDIVPNKKTLENIFRLSVMLAQPNLKEAQYDDELINAEKPKEGMIPNINNMEYGKNFVTEHVYVTDATILEEFTKVISPIPAGFQTVFDTIELENGFKADENKEEVALIVSKATCIRHIMNYMNGRESQVKKSINVLEIHPAFSAPKLNEMTKWAPAVKDVKTKVMTPEELMSSLDQLNDNYDLIYIGASTDYMNKGTSGTVYNNSELNGLIYHSTPDGNYKGNDISKKSKDDLVSFLNGDYPIIISEKLLTGNGQVDTSKVEADSNLYNFINEIKNENNVFIENKIKENDRLLQLYLNQPSIELSASLTDANNEVKNYQLIEEENGSYLIQYKFTISENGLKEEDARYSVNLYMDALGNGRYSKELDFTITENGSPVTGDLEPAKEYVLERALPASDYSGEFSTKLLVHQLRNPSVYAEATNTVKLVETEAEKIKVLQIGGDSSNTLDLEANLLVSGTPYNNKANEIKNQYDFNVEHCTMTELYEYLVGDETKKIEKNPDYLKQFDLCVVGFFNEEQKEVNPNVMAALKDYIADNKAVVFTANTRYLLEVAMSDIQSSDGVTYSFLNQNPGKYYNLDDNNNGNTMKASRTISGLSITHANEGTILKYPFMMPANISIGKNRGQDIRIDSSRDDLTVWCCLGNSDGNDTMYSLSPNDGSNNYYLYNQGAVYFSGFTAAADCSEKEVELFFNTMISAYHAGVKSPVIKVLESADKKAPELNMIYRLFDENFEGNGIMSGDYAERIYFTVADKNHMAERLELSGRFMYHKGRETIGDTSIKYHGADMAVKYLGNDAKVYEAVTNTEVQPNNNYYTLTSGQLYYIDVDNILLSECENGLDLYFEASSKFLMDKKVITPDPSYSKVEVTRIYLFDLK